MPENKNETFGLFVRNQQVERIIRRELKKLNGDGNAKPPFNLSAQVRRYPVEDPSARWDEAVNKIAAAAQARRRAASGEGAP